jgi:hypothetical protein
LGQSFDFHLGCSASISLGVLYRRHRTNRRHAARHLCGVGVIIAAIKNGAHWA